MAELNLRQSPWNEGLRSHPLLALRQQFQETEIGRLLLTLAVAVRNAMDQNPSRAEYWLQQVEDNVGSLETLGNKKGPESALIFREACNKLVHCLSINFHYVSDNPRRGMALTPLVHLYGTKS
jgi:hypothetical protein